MPASDWKEIVLDDEATRFERHAATLAALQKQRAANGSPDRALHAKANLGVEATFEVLAAIPEDARVGMFATPKTYRALVRFSNGAGRRQHDRKLDVRGFAVKLFGVDGKKLIPGLEDARTQDFLAIRTSVVPMRDTEEFMTLVRASTTPALLPLRLIGALGVRRGIGLIRSALAGLKLPQLPLAATSYYSALPIKYGPYAVQYMFAAEAAAPSQPILVVDPTHLGDELAARLRVKPVSYDVRIRFYQDPKATPIEDASVEWTTPSVAIARLVLPVQDPASPRGKRVSELVEKLSFDPWHAREDLRPLGNIMRARNAAYRTSTQARQALAEPAELPDLD